MAESIATTLRSVAIVESRRVVHFPTKSVSPALPATAVNNGQQQAN
jgi:hypothetical protein